MKTNRLKIFQPFNFGIVNTEKWSEQCLQHLEKKRIFKMAVIVLLFSLLGQTGIAQETHKFTATGFLEYLNTTWAPSDQAKWTNLSNVYNRIDLHWYPLKTLEFSAGIRNNFNFGPLMARYYPYYSNTLLKDYGWMDLTFNLAKDSSFLLYTNIDRLYMKWTLKNFVLTVGRQRINWGINLIWNPNDIFNTYNYFDFDYVERPGSDAILLRYYTGDFSSLQLAAKLDYHHQVTAAAMYKFNVQNYDLQFLGGVMKKDMVVGMGWAGQIKSVGFTGEASYFRNLDRFSDTTGQLVASVSANYTFPNQIYLNGSFIFNSAGTTGNAGRGTFFMLGNMNPKTLTRSKFDLFGEISYPITPLIKADVSCIYNPNDHSVFTASSLDISLTENMGLFVMGQLFFGNPGTEFGHYGQMYYLRLKWSF